MPDSTPQAKPKSSKTLFYFLLWLLLYFAARGFLEKAHFATGVRLGIALIPIPFFAAFLWHTIRDVRSADEFERRIHLEALAIAYPLAMLLLMTLALLQRAIELKFEDWSYAHVWIYLPVFYFLGLAIARRRYS